MSRNAFLFTLLVAALICSLPAAPARAQSIRTFVSTAGSDNPSCSLASPCRHFSAAVAATAPGGEVDALDAGAYGSFTIGHAITIEGQGWSYVAPPNGGAAITITAGSGDNIVIRGVSLNGVGASGGTNGIVFNVGGSLTVTDCVAQNFSNNGSTTGSGILLQPTSGTVAFAITNTIVANNGYAGIFYYPPSGSPSAHGVIDHVVATANLFGIVVSTSATSGATVAAISNIVASDNSAGGLYADNGPGPLTVSIDNASITANGNGIQAFGATKVLLGRSVITGNSTDGVFNATSPNTFYTYKDNRINLNATDISGALNTTLALQ